MSRTRITRQQVEEGTEPRDRRHPMSVRQLGQSVRYGRKITFRLVSGDPITGYLAGMDEKYYLVLQPTGGKEGFLRYCVACAGCLTIQIHTESSYEDEPVREQMEAIIGPFRGFVTNQIFGNGSSDSDARKAS